MKFSDKTHSRLILDKDFEQINGQLKQSLKYMSANQDTEFTGKTRNFSGQ